MTNAIQARYHTVLPKLGEYIIKHTSVIVNNRAKVCDSTALKKHDLSPKYMLEVDNTAIFISRIFLGKGDSNPRFGHPHVILYVENGKWSYVARNFYRSRSQGVWRLLPGVFRKGYYYKSSHGEQAINAPVILQKVLDELHKTYSNHGPEVDECLPPVDIGGFGGNDTEDFDNAFEKETKERPWRGFSKKTQKGIFSAPDRLILDSAESPDFSHTLMSWRDVDGNVKQAFASRNGCLEYEFLTDRNGRSCLALIECVDATINSFGLRSQFVQTGDYTTPLYEYKRQTKGDEMDYGDLDDVLFPYYSMWRRYLSRIPVIRDYTDYLRKQGFSVADYDNVAGQIEEDKICEVFRKVLENESLTAEEKAFITRSSEQFLYPETAQNAKKNLLSVLRKREAFRAKFLDTELMNAESLAKLIMYTSLSS